MKKLFLLTIVSLTLAGCGWFHNQENQYQKAQSIAPMQIPSNLDSSTIESKYPVPAIKHAPQRNKVNLTPPGLGK